MFVVCALIFVLVAVDLIAALWTRSPGRAALDVGSMVFCYWLAVGALRRSASADVAAATQQ